MNKEILIVGTGALACLFAARLAARGVGITMLGSWPEGLQALQQHGVRVVENGREQAYPVRATDRTSECAEKDLALVLVKSWQTGHIARRLTRCLAPEGVAVTLQNGLGNRETLAERLGEARVALGVTTTGATLVGPGRVRPGGAGVLSIEDHPRLGTLLDLLRDAGFEVESTPNADSLIWGKLVINAAINPLTALLRVPNGDLLKRPTARTLMAALAEEAANVAAAQGILLNFPDPAAAAEKVAHRTASNHSSMFQDVLRGAPTEIDAICGAIVKAGEATGVPTPVNWTLWQLVKADVHNL